MSDIHHREKARATVAVRLLLALGMTLGAASTMPGATTQTPVAEAAGGTLWAWGDNAWGQLGDGTVAPKLKPTQIGLSGVIQVAAGANHSVALTDDGTVWTWGTNHSGQLGEGNRALSRSMAARVPRLFNVKAIASGNDHVLALKGDGSVWSWGANTRGQLGNERESDRSDWGEPYQVDLPKVSSIAAGAAHSLALTDDGTIWA